MATNLPTNFQDDIIDTSTNTRRKYQMIQNSDNTVSFVDRTTYTEEGTSFGAGNVNAQNEAINSLSEALDGLVTLDGVQATNVDFRLSGTTLYITTSTD